MRVLAFFMMNNGGSTSEVFLSAKVLQNRRGLYQKILMNPIISSHTFQYIDGINAHVAVRSLSVVF